MVTQKLIPVSLTKRLQEVRKRTETTRIYKLSASSDTQIALHHACLHTFCLVLNTNERKDTLNLLKNSYLKNKNETNLPIAKTGTNGKDRDETRHYSSR